MPAARCTGARNAKAARLPRQTTRQCPRSRPGRHDPRWHSWARTMIDSLVPIGDAAARQDRTADYSTSTLSPGRIRMRDAFASCRRYAPVLCACSPARPGTSRWATFPGPFLSLLSHLPSASCLLLSSTYLEPRAIAVIATEFSKCAASVTSSVLAVQPIGIGADVLNHRRSLPPAPPGTAQASRPMSQSIGSIARHHPLAQLDTASALSVVVDLQTPPCIRRPIPCPTKIPIPSAPGHPAGVDQTWYVTEAGPPSRSSSRSPARTSSRRPPAHPRPRTGSSIGSRPTLRTQLIRAGHAGALASSTSRSSRWPWGACRVSTPVLAARTLGAQRARDTGTTGVGARSCRPEHADLGTIVGAGSPGGSTRFAGSGV